MVKKLFWFLVYFLSPMIPMIAVYNSNPAKYNNPSHAVPLIFGEIAYVWLMYEFVLSARPKFIERSFGMDKFYRFHGLMAIVSVLAVLIHQSVVKERLASELSTFFGSAATVLYIGVTILALIFIIDSILLKIKPVLIIRNECLKRFSLFKYNKQVIIHNISILAYAAMFIHVLTTDASKNSLAVRWIYIIYFIIGAMFYIYHKFVKKLILDKNMFRVKEVVKENNTMWTLKLVPDNGQLFSYKPGQFAFIKPFSSNIEKEEHPFSISSNPTNKDYISFTIKELGDFTSKIKTLKAGDKLHIDGPYGKFSYLEYPSEKTQVFIAGGVGIVPFLSMLRHMKSCDKNRDVIFLFGVNNRSDLICLKEFEEMEKEIKNFKFVPVMFKDDGWQGEKGLIHRERLERILKENNKNIASCGFYICGPSVMTNSIVPELKNMGIKRKHIHFEKFSM